MLVRAIATILEGGRKPKDVFELDDAIARDWIKRGWVKPHKPNPEVEFATVAPPEHAVSRRGRQREE